MRRALLIAALAVSGWADGPALGSEAVQAIVGQASGSFDVKLAPQTQGEGIPNGRMTIHKMFRGDLEGSSAGEMLTSSNASDGSGAYVAVERFSGSLAGHQGSFYFVHRGIMDRGRPDLAITVVPGSGTEGLRGLAGTLHLDQSKGRHDFVFDYSLPADSGN